jgi:hypothetical protein
VFIETPRLPSLSSGSIGAAVAAIADRPSPGCSIFTHEFRRAAARVPTEVTAFGLHRDHVLIEIIATTDAEPDGEAGANAVAHRDWAKAISRALAPFTLPGGYANMLADDDPERVRASFGSNAGRIAFAKRRFDPDNVFAHAIPLPRPREAEVAARFGASA